MNSTTLNEIAYNLLNTMRGGKTSHSEAVSLEQVKYTIKYYRALFIRRDFHRNFNRFRPFEQDLGHLDTKSVDSAEDSNLSSGNTILKTVKQIPKPVRLKNKEAITHVSCKDKVGEPIPIIEASRTAWTSYDKWTSDSPHATYRDGYIYIFNNISIQNINVRGVFEDPEEVFEFTSDNDIDAYDGKQSFPIATDMLSGITKGIINGELKLLTTTPDDEELGMNQDKSPDN